MDEGKGVWSWLCSDETGDEPDNDPSEASDHDDAATEGHCPFFYRHCTRFFECSPPAFSMDVKNAASVVPDIIRSATKKKTHRSRCCMKGPHIWIPSDEELSLMGAAFETCSMTWWCIDTRASEKPRWANKCLQRAVMSILAGQRRRHAMNMFLKFTCCFS